jgi:SulP family sulfate permease
MKPLSIAADGWAALSTMLVVMPASIAFGMTIYLGLGDGYAMMGALAGVLAAISLGFVAGVFGATERMMTTPSAPAAAVLAAFVVGSVQQGITPDMIILLMTLLGVLTGIFQIVIGFTRIGSLIKYIPHTVVSGYLTVVGLIIISSQLPTLLGVHSSGGFVSLLSPEHWQWIAASVGAVTAITMWVTSYFLPSWPATLLGMSVGIVSYFMLSVWQPQLRQLVDNPYVLGAFDVSLQGYVDTLSERWLAIGHITLAQVATLFGSALTLAVLLSIDTLKTAIVVDQFTHSNHEPNQELVAQGLANMASAAVGGVAGSGNMGATMVNVSSGAQTRYALLVSALLMCVVLLALLSLLAWLPKATLAAVLIVIGVRMIDLNALKLITSRSTIMDFGVVVIMVIVGLSFDLIAASVVGVVLSIALYLRAQVGHSSILRKSFLNQRSSSWYRTEEEVRKLEQKGASTVIFELQGSLFFGVARELYAELAQEAQMREVVIIDLLRVQSIDVTAAHVLAQIQAILSARGARLVICQLPDAQGTDMKDLLGQLNVIGATIDTKLFLTLDEAIEWAENKLLGYAELSVSELPLLSIADMDVFKNSSESSLQDLSALLVERHFNKGDKVYDVGDNGNELYFIRRGQTTINAPIGGGRRLHHIATLGQGNFFGGLSFLDKHAREDAALAQTDLDVFVLTREQFDQLTDSHKRLGFEILQSIAHSLGQRLRRSDAELTLLLA